MRRVRPGVSASVARRRTLAALVALAVSGAIATPGGPPDGIAVAGAAAAWAAPPKKPAKQQPAKQRPGTKKPRGEAARPRKGGKPTSTAPAKPGGGGRAGPRGPAAPPRDERVEIDVTRERLAGGVEVVVAPLPGAPVLAVAVVEGAGAASDPPGRGGLASLFAHLGGERASPERRARLVADRGGTSDLRIEADHVVASHVLPPGELELALWLEADRLAARPDEASLVEALRALGAARADERRLARHHDRLDALQYQGFAPYARPADGTPEELLAIRGDVVEGSLTSRPPRPVAIVIAGPVEAPAALEAARRHLGAIPAGPAPAARGELPEQINQRAAAIVDPRAKTAAVLFGFAVPPAGVASDGPAIELAAAVLAGGPRSRLERLLVDEGSASRVDAWLDRRVGPSSLRVEVEVTPQGDVVTLRERAERAIVELGKSSPRPEELARARAWLAQREADDLQRPDRLAARLGRAVVDGRQGPLGAWDLGRWRDVDGDAVARAAATHLSPIRRNVVEIHPQRPVDPPPTEPARRATPPPRDRKAGPPATKPAPSKKTPRKPASRKGAR